MTNPSDTQVLSINPLPLPPQEQSSNASQATVSLIFVITVFPSWASFYSLSPYSRVSWRHMVTIDPSHLPTMQHTLAALGFPPSTYANIQSSLSHGYSNLDWETASARTSVYDMIWGPTGDASGPQSGEVMFDISLVNSFQIKKENIMNQMSELPYWQPQPPRWPSINVPKPTPPIPHSDDIRAPNFGWKGAVTSIGAKNNNSVGEPIKFFVGPRGFFGPSKKCNFYSFTPEGWSNAWAEFSRVDPAAADGYRKLLESMQHQREPQVAREQRAQVIKTMPKFLTVDGCVLENGYNFGPFKLNMRGSFYFTKDRLIIVDQASLQTIGEFPYDGMIALRVGGPGAVTTGGGFFGGGFGVKGAVEGMLVATALNAVTTKTTTRTVIEIQDSNRDLIWSHDNVTPQGLESLLMPVRAQIRQCALPKAVSNPSDRLKKLSELHDTHQIDDAEFERARRQILDSI